MSSNFLLKAETSSSLGRVKFHVWTYLSDVCSELWCGCSFANTGVINSGCEPWSRGQFIIWRHKKLQIWERMLKLSQCFDFFYALVQDGWWFPGLNCVKSNVILCMYWLECGSKHIEYQLLVSPLSQGKHSNTNWFFSCQWSVVNSGGCIAGCSYEKQWFIVGRHCGQEVYSSL